MTQTNSESPPTPNQSAEPVVLDGGALPCGDCGQVVAAPDTAMVEKAEMVRNGRATVVRVAKCPACVERDRTSIVLGQRYLRGGVTRDGRRYTGKDAVTLLIEARAAIDAAGMEPSPVKCAARPAAVLAVEIVHLGNAIRGLRWRDRLSPPASLVADQVPLVEPGTANAHPWAHLDDGDRARLRRGFVKMLGDRVALQAPPVAIVPPTVPDEHAGHRGIPVNTGCLYCGVGSVTMTALAVARCGGADAAARSVWTMRQINPAHVGARRGGPTRLLGWLCPACERAAASEGSANSAGALEGALSAFLGVSRRTMAGDEVWVTGLQGWGALVANALRRDCPLPPANLEPWSHLSQAERDHLANALRLGGSAERA